MQVVYCEQGTPEWHALRCGRITASRFADVLSKGAGRRTYMLKTAAERLTGIVEEGYSNAAMEWGVEHEPQARAMYELVTDCEVEEVGFIIHSGYIGVSPDGLVGDVGLIEIKCPNTSTHLDTIDRGKVPAKYIKQIQGQLWVSGRAWCDFISFDPRIKGDGSLFIKRVHRDEKLIAEIEEGCLNFIAEMEAIIKKINTGES